MALYKDLLGHNLEKLAGVTVFDVTLYDGDNPLLTFDTLTISNVSVEGEQKEIRGGQGGNLLLSYDYAKTANLEITDALASIYSLKYIWGAQIKHENITALVRRKYDPKYLFEVVDAGTDDTIVEELKNLPDNYKEETDITLLIITKEDQYQIYGEWDEIDNIELQNLPVIDINDIKEVVVYYTMMTSDIDESSHVYELTLTTTDFPRTVRLVGETFFVDAETGNRVFAQLEIPKFKPSPNFELTFESEGDASVFDFSGTALADEGRLIILRTLGYEGEVETCEVHEIASESDVETIDFNENLLENISLWVKEGNNWILYIDEGIALLDSDWSNDWDQNEQFILEFDGGDSLIFGNGNEIFNDSLTAIELKVCWNNLTKGKNPQE